MANEIDFLTIDPSGSTSDLANEFEGLFANLGQMRVGWVHELYGVGFDVKLKGAMRFTNVIIPRGTSVNFAELAMYVGLREGAQPVKFKIWGIKETNVNTFSTGGGDYPFPKTKTNAYVTGQFDSGFYGQYKRIGVNGIINEIVGQSGWSSGNALAFLIEDDGTVTDKGNQYIASIDTVLSVRVNTEPNFYPTPGSVAAPTFPAAKNHGIRFVAPGNNVLTSEDTPEITTFTTKRRCDFIKTEGVITTQAGVEYLIAHGVTGKPRAEIYFMSSTGSQRFRAPRVFPPVQSGADRVDGKVNVDSTYIRITTSVACNVYYRIFLDKIV
jgi:hypothetical protein